MVFTPTQEKALAIVPKFSAALSMLGSGWIVTEIATSPEKQGHVYHRLLGAFAIIDILESMWSFASTWPMPKSTPNVYGASGNTATCTAQGFFLQIGVALPFYNASIAIYYLLAIRYNYSEKKLHKYAEPCMHAIPLSFAVLTSVTALVMRSYNAANVWCWLAELPRDCTRNEDIDCIRGRHADAFRWAFFFVPLWINCVIVMWALAMVYRGIYKCEELTGRYRNPELERLHEVQQEDEGQPVPAWRQNCCRCKRCIKRHPRSYAVASQALCYVLAFYLTFTFSTVNRFLQQAHETVPFATALLHVLFDPMQGFFNWLVYRRPKYLQIRRKNKDLSRLQAAWRTLQWTFLEKKTQSAVVNQTPQRRPHPHRRARPRFNTPRSQRMSELIKAGVIQEFDDASEEFTEGKDESAADEDANSVESEVGDGNGRGISASSLD